MALMYDIAGAQIDGARDYQEDAFLITHLTDSEGNPSTLLIVADGMGGHAAGNVASNMAVQAFNKHISSNYPGDDISQVLHEAILKANHSIAETIKETPALEGMGCTMVAALVEHNGVWWASVGDSHLYLIRNKELSKINADHSYGGFLDAMEAAGTPVEPEPGLSRNMLMSAITGSDISEIDVSSSPLKTQAGDKIIICSDGMDTLSEGKIIQYCDWSDSPKECAESLLNAVEEAEMPKQDNTTVVVVNIIDKDAAAQPPAAAEDEEDDDDITDTSGQYQKPDLDKTADIEQPVAEPEAEAPIEISADDELETEPPPQPGVPVEAIESPLLQETPASAAKEAKGGKGMIIGIAAVVLIAVIGGAYVFLGGEEAPLEPLPVDVEPLPEEPVEEIMEETEVVVETTEEAPVVEDEVEAEEPSVEEARVETPPEEKAPAEPAAKAEPEVVAAAPGKEIQDALKSGGKGPVMLLIPAGTFEMGSPSSVPHADERPQHKVNVDSFAISRYEVTFTEYDEFAKATGRKIPDNLYLDRETHPVIFVSWDDAYNYTKWLSEQTGHIYRLPSEAEWEYAASGGKDTPFWWGYDEMPGVAHCYTCESQFDPRKPTKVGSFKPNPFGLYDTSGNVAEWTYDCWHKNYDGAPSDGSVWEGGDCRQRIIRGGSYHSPQSSIRTAKRDKLKSDSGYEHVGIRVVRELP